MTGLSVLLADSMAIEYLEEISFRVLGLYALQSFIVQYLRQLCLSGYADSPEVLLDSEPCVNG